MIFAITGGTGFVGEALADRLVHKGHEVKVLTRNPSYEREGITSFVGDLVHESSELNSFVQDVDVLFHCCGELNDTTKMRSLHVDGTKKLILAATGNVGRWVQLSSVGVYGRCRSGLITEEFLESPMGEYEQTKAMSDHLVESSEIPSTILRPSIVFGHRMPNQSLLQLIRAISSKRFFYIGKHHAILNYVHIDDVVHALMLCGADERAIGNTYISSQSVYLQQLVQTTLDCQQLQQTFRRISEPLARIFASLLGWTKNFPLTTGRVDALTGRCIYDSSKIQGELKFEFGRSLEEQLQSFVIKKQKLE